MQAVGPEIINALNYVQRGYGQSEERLEGCIDRGQDLEDVRPGTASDLGQAHFGIALIASLRNRVDENWPLDVAQLDADLEFILIDQGKPGSHILYRATILNKHGGIRMYAEVFKWFLDTSGLGLMEQAALLMNLKQAAQEYYIAEEIDVWEEKVNRLARHGDDHHLSESFRKFGLQQQMPVGKIKDNFELWQAEKMSFE